MFAAHVYYNDNVKICDYPFSFLQCTHDTAGLLQCQIWLGEVHLLDKHTPPHHGSNNKETLLPLPIEYAIYFKEIGRR